MNQLPTMSKIFKFSGIITFIGSVSTGFLWLLSILPKETFLLPFMFLGMSVLFSLVSFLISKLIKKH